MWVGGELARWGPTPPGNSTERRESCRESFGSVRWEWMHRRIIRCVIGKCGGPQGLSVGGHSS